MATWSHNLCKGFKIFGRGVCLVLVTGCWQAAKRI